MNSSDYCLSAAWAGVIGLFFALVWLLLPLLGDPFVLLAFYHDDFFFYQQISSHLARGLGSTFDGVHLTNGYHPLWLLVLTGVNGLSSYFSIAEMVAVHSLIVLLGMLGSYWLYQWLLSASTSPLFAPIFAWLGVLIFLMYGVRGGMEVIITLPLLMLVWQIYHAAQSRYLLFWLAVTLCVLSRLDSLVVIAPLVVRYLFQRTRSPFELLALLIPVGLLAGYMLANYLIFDTPLPISGLVKSADIGLYSATWKYLFTQPSAVLLVIGALAVLAATAVGQFSREPRESYLLLAVGVVMFYLQNSMRSDWTLWTWYLYPLAFLVIVGIPQLSGFFDRRWGGLGVGFRWAWLLPLPPVLLLGCALLMVPGPSVGIAEAAAQIRLHQQARGEGMTLYAMGDRAGMPGYVIRSPLIPLEGLVMDTDYLRMLKSTEVLEDLLLVYGVDYYIATTISPPDDDCRHLYDLTQSPSRSLAVFRDGCWPLDDRFTTQDGGRTLWTSIYRNPSLLETNRSQQLGIEGDPPGK